MNRCAWSAKLIAKNTRPNAPWRFIQALRARSDAVADDRSSGQVAYGDFAVLYRANHQSRVSSNKNCVARRYLTKSRGGQSFFDRAEIKDLCAWMRLLVNQDDDPAFLRAVTTPKRGIGHTTLGKPWVSSQRQVEGAACSKALFSPSLNSGAGCQGHRRRCTSSAAT